MQHIGIQQLLILFLVQKTPGVLRTEVRNHFRAHKMSYEGVDKCIRELDESKGLLSRAKTKNGTVLRLSKSGEKEVAKFSNAFRLALN